MKRYETRRIEQMKSAVFIPVRMKSTRLPNKALLEIKGKPVIEHLIDRVKLAKLPDLIVLCATKHPEDEILVGVAQKNGICYFQGSEKDILDRYLKAALKFGVDFIVNVDGDDVFCDPEYMDRVIELFVKTGADFIKCEGLPFGAAPSGIKVGSA
jgi:spore coat polysaccharide biosynthesis protein SpsF